MSFTSCYNYGVNEYEYEDTDEEEDSDEDSDSDSADSDEEDSDPDDINYEDFVSHRCPNNNNFNLYHVYDNLSRTPYCLNRGITAGNPNISQLDPWQIITPDTMAEHLDWWNPDPTHFISLYDDYDMALEEAYRRQNHPWITNDETGEVTYRDPNTVRIAVVDASRLDAMRCFYFSTEQMWDMIEPQMDEEDMEDEVWDHTKDEEWFVVGHIPEWCIVENYALQRRDLTQ